MTKGYYLVFSTAIISGFAIFINKFGVKVINPHIFTFLKNLTTALFLSGLLLSLKDWKKLKNLTRKQWFWLIMIGLIGGSVPFLLFFKGLSLTNPANASFLHKTMFIWVAILALLFLKEKIDKKFLLGGLFLVLGILILFEKLTFSFQRGDFLVFLATLLWAIENTISKYVLKSTTLQGRQVAWARMFFGSLFIFIYLGLAGQLPLLANLSLKQISWVFITGIILFGYVMTWYSGLKYVPISKATTILLLGSPITTLLTLIWNRQVNLQGILAGVLIILGIILVIGIKEILEFLKSIKKIIYLKT